MWLTETANNKMTTEAGATYILVNLSFRNTSAWEFVKALRNKKSGIPPLTALHGRLLSSLKKTEVLADSLEAQCAPNVDVPSFNILRESTRRSGICLKTAPLQTMHQLRASSCLSVSDLGDHYSNSYFIYSSSKKTHCDSIVPCS